MQFSIDNVCFAFKVLIEDDPMSRMCQVTKKRPMIGNSVSHANNKTKRRFLPNLRTVRINLEDGTKRKIRISASLLRTLKKQK